jgi:hypothetical protein
MLSAHYRNPINFSHDLMEAAKNGLDRIITAVTNLTHLEKSAKDSVMTEDEKKVIDSTKDIYGKFEAAMDDDFNTPIVISYLFEAASIINKIIDGKEKINYHAHLVFHNYDFDKHITIKRDKDVMRKLQTDVAKSLGMERGLENSQAVRFYITIGQTHGEVGIRIGGDGLFHFTQATDVGLVEQFHSAFQFHVLLSEFLQLFVLGARVSRSRVFLDGFHGGLCQEFIQVLAVGEDGVVVNVVYVCVVVALELSVDGLVEGGQLVGVQCLGKGGQDGFGYGAVHFVVVVFIVDTIVCIFQLLLRSLQQ